MLGLTRSARRLGQAFLEQQVAFGEGGEFHTLTYPAALRVGSSLLHLAWRAQSEPNDPVRAEERMPIDDEQMLQCTTPF